MTISETIFYLITVALLTVTVLVIVAIIRPANANEESLQRCGKRLIYAWGHHGFTFTLLPKGEAVTAAVVDLNSMNDIDETMWRPVPLRQARFVCPAGDGRCILYFRGRKCTEVDHR
jgi:hypothetical protein